MAEENQDGQEKTEEPSQRKIDKHKEDGKVLSSKEMFVFTGIAGALLLMYAFSFSDFQHIYPHFEVLGGLPFLEPVWADRGRVRAPHMSLC